jgi:hypothetical protein
MRAVETNWGIFPDNPLFPHAEPTTSTGIICLLSEKDLIQGGEILRMSEYM